MLALDDVSVAYGKVEAVRGVSLAIPRGSIVTVIGANGAGKTTLLNAAMGLLPSRGRIAFDGTSLDGLAIEERVALGLALVPERRELFGSMTVADNLALGAFRRPAAERGDALAQV
jgi:branched-chain amino acid transport system ATP-binding protein